MKLAEEVLSKFEEGFKVGDKKDKLMSRAKRFLEMIEKKGEQAHKDVTKGKFKDFKIFRGDSDKEGSLGHVEYKGKEIGTYEFNRDSDSFWWNIGTQDKSFEEITDLLDFLLQKIKKGEMK